MNHSFIFSRMEANCLQAHGRGKSAKEIACMYGAPVNTVYVSIALAKKKLEEFDARMLAFAREHAPFDIGSPQENKHG